jgi:hypothetical protein
MAREELKWQNIDADDLPAEVKKSFDALQLGQKKGHTPLGPNRLASLIWF